MHLANKAVLLSAIWRSGRFLFRDLEQCVFDFRGFVFVLVMDGWISPPYRLQSVKSLFVDCSVFSMAGFF